MKGWVGVFRESSLLNIRQAQDPSFFHSIFFWRGCRGSERLNDLIKVTSLNQMNAKSVSSGFTLSNNLPRGGQSFPVRRSLLRTSPPQYVPLVATVDFFAWKCDWLLEWKLPKGRASVFPFCSPLSPQTLAQFIAPRQRSVYICWLSGGAIAPKSPSPIHTDSRSTSFLCKKQEKLQSSGAQITYNTQVHWHSRHILAFIKQLQIVHVVNGPF